MGGNAETENGHRDFVLVLVSPCVVTYYVASCAGIVWSLDLTCLAFFFFFNYVLFPSSFFQFISI